MARSSISIKEALEILDTQGRDVLWHTLHTIAHPSPNKNTFFHSITKYLYRFSFQQKEEAEDIGSEVIEKMVYEITYQREQYNKGKDIDRHFIRNEAIKRAKDKQRPKNKQNRQFIIQESLDDLMQEYDYQLTEKKKISLWELQEVMDKLKDDFCSELLMLFFYEQLSDAKIAMLPRFQLIGKDNLRKRRSNCLKKHSEILQNYLKDNYYE